MTMRRLQLAKNLATAACILLSAHCGGRHCSASAFSLVDSHRTPRPALSLNGGGRNAAATLTRLSGGGGKDEASSTEEALKDRSSEASALFGNLRVPAALFAGAAAASAFALPLSPADDLRVGMVKRVYALVMMGSMSSEIVAVIVSTVAMAHISSNPNHGHASCVGDFMRKEYELEWVAARIHFLLGLVGFLLGIGMRAWVTISCPIIARAASGFIVSAAILAVAFADCVERSLSFRGGLVSLPFRALVLLVKRARTNPLFAIALIMSAVTWGYTIGNIPHIYHYLAGLSVA